MAICGSIKTTRITTARYFIAKDWGKLIDHEIFMVIHRFHSDEAKQESWVVCQKVKQLIESWQKAGLLKNADAWQLELKKTISFFAVLKLKDRRIYFPHLTKKV